MSNCEKHLKIIWERKIMYNKNLILVVLLIRFWIGSLVSSCIYSIQLVLLLVLMTLKLLQIHGILCKNKSRNSLVGFKERR